MSESIRRKRLHDYSEQSLIAYLQDLAQRLGRQRITIKDLKADGEVSRMPFLRIFGGLPQALIAAGLRPAAVIKANKEHMLRELAGLMQQLGREPNGKEIKSALPYSVDLYKREFGTLKSAFDAAEQLTAQKTNTTSPNEERRPYLIQVAKKRTRRYGADIDFRGLRHAPINEQGVVFLFGMLSTELGFRVESIQVGFPDCEAKIRLPDGTYERVSIEFEYLSSHFPQHGHDASQCDYIVCWLHDWKECPHDMNVIVLADEVKRLTSDTQVMGKRHQP